MPILGQSSMLIDRHKAEDVEFCYNRILVGSRVDQHGPCPCGRRQGQRQAGAGYAEGCRRVNRTARRIQQLDHSAIEVARVVNVDDDAGHGIGIAKIKLQPLRRSIAGVEICARVIVENIAGWGNAALTQREASPFLYPRLQALRGAVFSL